MAADTWEPNEAAVTEPQSTGPKDGLPASDASNGSGREHFQGLSLPLIMGRACWPAPLQYSGWLESKSSIKHSKYRDSYGTSMVVQELQIHKPGQGTGLWLLVQEDSTHQDAAEPMRQNYWACTPEPLLHNKRSHWNEKPTHGNWWVAIACHN